jgi:hypothetical protein
MEFKYKKSLVVSAVLFCAIAMVIWANRQLPAIPARSDHPVRTSTGQTTIPGPNKIVTETSETFDEAINKLDLPDKIVDYLKDNFTISDTEIDTALNPKEFFTAKTGGTQDAAIFMAYALNYHGFEAGVIRYAGTSQGKDLVHTVAIFRDKDTPKYLSISNGKIELIAHGWSFADLIEKEESRTGGNIQKYAFFESGVTNLSPAEWINIR